MKKILSIGFLLYAINVISQPAFNFSASTSAYSDIGGGTAVTLTQAHPTIGITDDGFANAVPIGFSFSFNGVAYTTCNVNTNGFISFGNAMANNYDSYGANNLTNGPVNRTNIRPIIAPFWADLDAVNASNMRYATTGSAPNRVFTFEWKNAKFIWTTTSSNLSFQVKLYEGTNNVSFHYRQEMGSVPIGGAAVASVGLTNSSLGSGSFLSLNNVGASPTVSSTIETNNIGVRPATDQMYLFAALNACAGTPTAGTASSSVMNACANQYFTLSVSGNTTGTGISYQWERSINSGVNWSNVPNANGASINTISQTVETQYRCKVTCANGGAFANTNVLNVGMNTIGCPIANNEPEGAILLTHGDYNSLCTGVSTYNSSTATASPFDPFSFANSIDDDIWYYFVATNDKVTLRLNNLTTASGTYVNERMEYILYSGTAGNLTAVYVPPAGIKLDGGVSGETTLFGLTVGTNYYVRLFSQNNTWRAAGNFCISTPNISAGSPGTCFVGRKPAIGPAFGNTNVWVPVMDSTALIAEINANNNTLGEKTPTYYVHNATVRRFMPTNRYYLDRNISLRYETKPTTAISIRLYFRKAELDALIAQSGSGVSSIADLKITRREVTCSNEYTAGGNYINPTATANYGTLGGYVQFNTTDSGTYFLHGGANILPNNNLNLTGERMINSIKLSWKASLQTDVSTFVLEKSVNGKDFGLFSSIRKSEVSNEYSIIDAKPFSTTTYYRIKQQNVDGSYNYSNIVAIKGLKALGLQLAEVYPNPVNSKLNVLITAEVAKTAQLVITDLAGKMVSNTTCNLQSGENNISLDVNNLSTGNYLLQVIEKSQKSNVVKIVKQ